MWGYLRNKMLHQQLSFDNLRKLIQSNEIEKLTYPEIVTLFRQEEGIQSFQPDHIALQDPRNNERVLFNGSRAIRPHDNTDRNSSNFVKKTEPQDCIICTGQTTRIIDLTQLSNGYTFINKNLYPIVYPMDYVEASRTTNRLNSGEKNAFGVHFLQWTSTFHELDWHNMPLGDLVVVMKRLAALEKTLLTTSSNEMPSLEQFGDSQGRSGFVSVIKNSGSPVGGSIEHGHQQIVFSNIMPRRIEENFRFRQERGMHFSDYVLRENPDQLLVREYDHAALLVPYYMRRPFDMLLLVKDTEKSYLHELSYGQLESVVAGWQDGIKLQKTILSLKGRPIAYNVLTHNGPGAGLYFEFLPFTQEDGGYEKLGLSVCQSNPFEASELLKQVIEG
jgi:galactose-1-phosphate uridylyltransferase